MHVLSLLDPCHACGHNNHVCSGVPLLTFPHSCVCFYLFIQLSIRQFLLLSAVFIRSFPCPSVRPSVCLFVCLPACMSIYMSTYLSVVLSVSLCLYLPLSTWHISLSLIFFGVCGGVCMCVSHDRAVIFLFVCKLTSVHWLASSVKCKSLVLFL